MEAPKMKTMRLDIISLKDFNLSLLVDQESNGIYFSKIQDHKDTLRSLYSDFKYRYEEMKFLNFYLPNEMKDQVIKLNPNVDYLI